jgi:hypothetical protein
MDLQTSFDLKVAELEIGERIEREVDPRLVI